MLKLTGIALSILLLSAIGSLPYNIEAQTQAKYFSYENKQYGFSIKYPSNWEKDESLTKNSVFSNVFDIVTFSTPSGLTNYGVSLIQDDTYKGLSGQKFLDKIKTDFVDSFCSKVPAGVTCSTELVQQTTLTHQNGYSGYMVFYGINVSSSQGAVESSIILGFYPNGNDVWMVGVGSRSADEFQQYTNEFSAIGSSFTISNYVGEQTTTKSSTSVKSTVGVLQINSGHFAASRYAPAELIVSGQINNYLQGVPLTIKIIKPDKSSYEQKVLVTKDGVFRVPIKLDDTWAAGSYDLSASYGTQNLGTVSFQVNMDGATTKSTKQQTTQSKKNLTYENKKYGISLKYPSDWQKEETLEKDETYPEIMNIVEFGSPSEEATFSLGIIQNDKGTSQKMLAELTGAKDEICSEAPAEASCSVEISEKRLTHKNGYEMHVTTLLAKMSYLQESAEIPATFTIIPDGKNTWVMLSGVFSTNPKQLLKEITSISESIKISNYKGSTQSSIITEQGTSTTQKQFSLNVKAIQDNDQITITISSPKDSSSDIYGIKLTTTTGKIKNYIKVNGWDHKRISDNTVSYQTKSSPLGQSDIIKIKLKVDSKKPEITWTAYSKDQKSLGTGKVRP